MLRAVTGKTSKTALVEDAPLDAWNSFSSVLIAWNLDCQKRSQSKLEVMYCHVLKQDIRQGLF